MKKAMAAVALVLGLGLTWYFAGGEDDAEVASTEGSEESARPRQASLGARRAMEALLTAPLPPPRGDLTIRGRVVAGGAPVEGATVVATLGTGEDLLSDRPCQCDNECGQMLLQCGCGEAAGQLVELVAQRHGEAPPIARATTGSDGTFELEGLEKQNYALWAEHTGRGTAVKTPVSAGAEEVEIQLLEGLTLSGRVLTHDESAVAGALVTAIYVDNSRFFETVTDATGAFRLGPLPEGDYNLVSSREGLLPEHQKVGKGDYAGIEVRLSAPRTLAGKVTRQGEPVSGATVGLEGNHKKHQATSDGQGGFRFAGLRPGEYQLLASQAKLTASASVELQPGDDLTDARLELEVGASVEGRVTDDSGAPIEGARIQAWSVDDGRSARAKTDAQGRFTLSSLTPGQYWVSASAKGYLEPHGSSSQRKELTAGAHIVDLKLRRGVSIRGVVVDPDGNPVHRADVTARPPPGEGTTSSIDRSNKDGSFEISGLAPGNYSLQARHDRFRTATQNVSAPGDGIRLVLERGGTVRGRFLDEQGHPQSHADVMLLPNADLFEQGAASFDAAKRATTSAQGEFSFEGIAEGRYVLSAQVATRGEDRTTRVASEELDFRGGSLDVELRLEEGLSISGKVVDANQHPIGDAKVTATPDRESLRRTPKLTIIRGSSMSTVRTTAEGTFELRHLHPGKYRLLARKEGFTGGITPVKAEAGQTGVTLVLSPEGRIHGRVVDASGRPIPDFWVDGDKKHSPMGEFEVPIRVSGEQVLVFNAAGYAPTTRELNADVGQDLSMGDVVLTRGRELSVHVVDAVSGHPLAEAHVSAGAPDLSQRSSRSKRLERKTGPDGVLRLSAVDDGPLDLEVSHAGYVPFQSTVPPGQAMVNVRLDPGGKIVGVVKDAQGRPIGGAWVEAMPLATPGRMAVLTERIEETKADGTFELGGLAPGRYHVAVEQGRRPEPRQYAIDARVVELAARATVRVEMQERSGGINVTLRVFGADGAELFTAASLARGEVAMPANLDDWQQRLAEAYRPAREAARSVFKAIPAGRYTLFVWQADEAGIEAHRQDVELAGQSERTLEVRLPRKLIRIALPTED